MSIVMMILATVVALEHVYIFYLETVVTQSVRTARVFSMSQDDLAQPTVTLLFKNQGVYNLGLALVMGYAILTGHRELVLIVALFVAGVAAYGAASSNPKILLTQGGPAILTLLSSFF